MTDSVVKDSLITAADGKSYRIKTYNLDMILALPTALCYFTVNRKPEAPHS